MTVIAVQNVYVVAGDMDRAAHFYAHALGLTEKFRDGARWTQYKVGSGNFSLASAEEAGRGAATGATPVFETDTLEETIAAVEQAGGRIVASRDMGSHGRTATCADPDGNIFQLFARS